jgi:hypothetical protein
MIHTMDSCSHWEVSPGRGGEDSFGVPEICKKKQSIDFSVFVDLVGLKISRAQTEEFFPLHLFKVHSLRGNVKSCLRAWLLESDR